MAIRLTLKTNLPGVAGKYLDLPKRMEEAAPQITREWAKAAQKSAKQRAPRSSTAARGTLAEGIRAEPAGKGKKTWMIGVFGPARRYAMFQEKGYQPHWIPIEYIHQHEQNPGQPGQWVSNPSRFVLVSGHKPFLTPAMEASRSKIRQIYRKEITKALKRR